MLKTTSAASVVYIAVSIRESVSDEFSPTENASSMQPEFMGSMTKGGLTAECGKGQNEGRSTVWRPLPIGRPISPVGRIFDNGLENTQIENFRANFPLNGAN